MSIDNAQPLTNASEGFRIVSERDTNDFAFIHDANEIKYEMARFVILFSNIFISTNNKFNYFSACWIIYVSSFISRKETR